MTADTIFALASGAGKAGVAVYRVSGPKAGNVFSQLCGKENPSPRTAVRITLTDPGSGEVVDDGLALWFPAPASFTGEDVVELHLHGGRAVMTTVNELLSRSDFLRLAEPGEFTRRAFEHGKMDLTAAEGLADLINAETEAQRLQAQRQLRGALGEIYTQWSERLKNACALFEAEIDFSDEELPDGLHRQVDEEINALIKEVGNHLDDKFQGQIVRDGFYVTIVGQPNAGKSSLLNALSQRDVAIVSEIAGTTRDIIEVHLDIEGFPVIVADTAGIRETDDAIESEGVRRARARAEDADLVLAVIDGERLDDQEKFIHSLDREKTILLLNKIDLSSEENAEKGLKGGMIGLSAKTGRGLTEVIDLLSKKIADRCQLSVSPSLTRARHRTAVEECLEALGRYRLAKEAELKAEDLRLAARALGRITGRVGVEDILDVIFAEFCIGK